MTLARTLEIEKQTHHDIMAMVKAMAEQSPTYGGFVHLGATSQDVNDTVLALQMSECKAALLDATRSVRAELTRLAEAHKKTVCIGRTHGQHAIPITMGFKFANFLYEFTVAERFLERVEVRALEVCVCVLYLRLCHLFERVRLHVYGGCSPSTHPSPLPWATHF